MIRRTFTVLGPYTSDFGVMKDNGDGGNGVEEDLFYDPVYHKVVSTQSEEFQNISPTSDIE